MEKNKIITFCGHSEIFDKEKLKECVLSAIANVAKDKPITFYLGEYGDFDYIAKICANEYKQTHTGSELIFVTPYLDKQYIENKKSITIKFDDILFPQIENVPKKYAIIERNKWMIKQSDYVIAYVKYSWGGATKTLQYATKLNKFITNIVKSE